jgi:Ala-tRNA(Pro) deacylase
MALIPSGDSLRTEFLKEILECESIGLAETEELSELFPDCEPHAVPPLGMLHGMRVFASDELARSRCLAFHAGSRSRVVEISWRDYFRLVVPIIAPISVASGTHTRGRPARAQAPELCLS